MAPDTAPEFASRVVGSTSPRVLPAPFDVRKRAGVYDATTRFRSQRIPTYRVYNVRATAVRGSTAAIHLSLEAEARGVSRG